MWRALPFLFALSLTAQTPVFEVASVKPNTSTERGGSMEFGPGRVSIRNLQLAQIVMRAFSVYDWQFANVEPMRRTFLPLLMERYDIEAKAAQPVGPAAMKLMLQSLLEERFKLAMHRELKEMQGYALTVDQGGSKLHDHEGGGPECAESMTSQGAIRARNCPIHAFAGRWLGSLVRGIVADQTGLSGNYDIELYASWEVPANPGEGRPEPRTMNPDAPPVSAAMRQQLGLRLEARKINAEMVTIDHVERPAAN